MAQLHWNYTNNLGQRYVVGLYHGTQSGHFIAYCNSAVIIIDFNVKNSKSYSFLINDELAQIKIEQQNGGFTYDFDVTSENQNEEDDSSSNENKWIAWGAASVGLLIILIVAFTQFFKAKNHRYLEANKLTLLESEGKNDWAKVFVRKTKGSALLLNFSFVAKGRPYGFTKEFSNVDELPFPIQSGDFYNVTFLPDHPDINTLNLSQPAPKTITRIKEELISTAPEWNSTVDSEIIVACKLDFLREKHGLKSWALLLHHNTAETEHKVFNSTSFNNFVQEQDLYTQLDKACR